MCILLGDSDTSATGDSLDCHSELVGGGCHVQDHGLSQVSLPEIIAIVNYLVCFRIFGFYASGFILIVISLDR